MRSGGKLLSKKNFYFVCVLALNLIEVLKATRSGAVWIPAVNATGFVMFALIVSECEWKKFLRLSNYIFTGLCMIAMILVRIHWSRHIGEYLLWQAETAVMNVWWIVLVIRYKIEEYIARKKMPKVSAAGYLWIFVTLWTVIGRSEKIWPVWFFLMFVCFYLTEYKKEDFEALWDAVSNGIIVSFFLVQGYAYLFRPYDTLRYRGTYTNCNMMALYYLIVYIAVLCKIHQMHLKSAKAVWKLFYFILAGGLNGFMVLTLCRTAWISAAMVTVCFGFTAIKGAWEKRWGNLILHGGAFLICVILTFFPVFWTVRYLPTIHPHPVWFEDEDYGEYRVHSWDPADSEKFTDIDEFLPEIMGRLYTVKKLKALFSMTEKPWVLRVYAAEDTESIVYVKWDDTINERMAIYRAYLKNSGWLGRADSDIEFQYTMGGQVLHSVWHAQNVWVQWTYTFGYPVGILSGILIILIFVKALRNVRNTQSPHCVFALLVILTFMIFGLTEVVWLPGQLIMTLLFLTQHPQLKTVRVDDEDLEGVFRRSI